MTVVHNQASQESGQSQSGGSHQTKKAAVPLRPMKSGRRLGLKHLQFDRFLSDLKNISIGVLCWGWVFVPVLSSHLRLCIYYISALPLSYIPSPWFFETESYCVDQADVKLEISCLRLLSASIEPYTTMSSFSLFCLVLFFNPPTRKPLPVCRYTLALLNSSYPVPSRLH